MSEEGRAIAEIDVDALDPLLEAGAALVDVRMPDEYEAGHVPGAVLVPLPELPERVETLPAGSPLYVICRSGARSMKACEFLAARGRDAVNVGGGTMAWIESGRRAVDGPEPG